MFNSEVYVSDTRYSGEQVIKNIHDLLIRDYAIKNAVYKKNLYFSDYYRLIDEAAGVDHHKTTLSFVQFYSFKSAYLAKINLNLTNILPGSVKLYIRDATKNEEWKLLGHDDGVGTFVGDYVNPADPAQGKYDLNNATISYADGSVGDVLVTYGLSESYSNYEIKIDFELNPSEEGDLKLQFRQQLFAYYDDKITIHLMGI